MRSIKGAFLFHGAITIALLLELPTSISSASLSEIKPPDFAFASERSYATVLIPAAGDFGHCFGK